MNSFKEWMLNQFDQDELEDIVQHGVISGFSGLIYYRETVALYQKYKEEIWHMLSDDADVSSLTILEFIASFNHAKQVNSSDQFANLLVWYAAEKIADEAINDAGV